MFHSYVSFVNVYQRVMVALTIHHPGGCFLGPNMRHIPLFQGTSHSTGREKPSKGSSAKSSQIGFVRGSKKPATIQDPKQRPSHVWCRTIPTSRYMGVSENVVSTPFYPMVLLIIIPIKWLFHWEYTLFSDKPKSFLVSDHPNLKVYQCIILSYT